MQEYSQRFAREYPPKLRQEPDPTESTEHGAHNPAKKTKNKLQLANRLPEACTLILDIFDIGHPCYGIVWSIDTCRNKVSADQYHVTIAWAHVWT